MVPAHSLRYDRCFCILCCCLLFLLNACNAVSNNPNFPTPTRSVTKLSATSILSPSPSFPTTQGNNDCPASGTVHAAIMPPLTLGHHQNVVYTVNEYSVNPGGVNQPTFGTLKRYDVTTGQKTEIIQLPGTEIADAQLSADGQWLLFIAITGTQAKLKLIRMDGKALQTLYCPQPASNSTEASFSLGDIQWSLDQKRVVFLSQSNTMETLYLLNMQNGSLQVELSGTLLPTVFTWLDATRLYLVNPEVDAPPTNLYLLDTDRVPPQSVAHLQAVYQARAIVFCWNAASNTNGTQLFISQCTSDKNAGSPAGYPSHGPSSITIQSATGSSPQTIFSSVSLGITAIRVISSTSLLLLVKSFGPHIDTSQNGLWKVNTDGTGLTFLSHDSATLNNTLNRYSQYPWSNVSRDGNLYSLQSQMLSLGVAHHTLLIGSLHGGSPTAFASIADGTRLDLVGWTTM